MSLLNQETEYKNGSAIENEIRLIRLCASTGAAGFDTARISEIIKSGINWNLFLRLCESHRVVPLVRASFALGDNNIPETVSNTLHQENLVNAQSTLFLTHQLTVIAKLLNSQNVDIIPLKGPSLASRVYSDIALRQSGDLDLLVRSTDVSRIFDILLKSDFGIPLFPSGNTNVRHVGHLIEARRTGHYEAATESGANIEIHTELGLNYLPFALSNDNLWLNATSSELFGTKMYILHPITELLYLIHHGSKHGWYCLGWICDIAQFIRTHDEINWGELLENARCHRMLTSALVAFALVRDFLGSQIPDSVTEMILKTPKVDRTLRIVDKAHRSLISRSAYERYQHKFRCYVMDSEEQRLRYCAMRVLTPTYEDWKFCPLPENMIPFYYVVRPVRLAKLIITGRDIAKLGEE